MPMQSLGKTPPAEPELFAERTVTLASIQDIACLADIAAAALIYFFTDKRTLPLMLNGIFN